jgi:tRNA G10  N-methylase Trm11
VLDPFAGGATTVVVGRRLGRKAGGIELHSDFVKEGLRRIAANLADDKTGHFLGQGKLDLLFLTPQTARPALDCVGRLLNAVG